MDKQIYRKPFFCHWTRHPLKHLFRLSWKWGHLCIHYITYVMCTLNIIHLFRHIYFIYTSLFLMSHWYFFIKKGMFTLSIFFFIHDPFCVVFKCVKVKEKYFSAWWDHLTFFESLNGMKDFQKCMKTTWIQRTMFLKDLTFPPLASWQCCCCYIIKLFLFCIEAQNQFSFFKQQQRMLVLFKCTFVNTCCFHVGRGETE